MFEVVPVLPRLGGRLAGDGRFLEYECPLRVVSGHSEALKMPNERIGAEVASVSVCFRPKADTQGGKKNRRNAGLSVELLTGKDRTIVRRRIAYFAQACSIHSEVLRDQPRV